MFEPDAITALVRRLRVIWFAQMLSVATLYLVVWFLLRKGGIGATGRLDPNLLGFLGGGVAATLLLAPIVRRRVEKAPHTAGPEDIVRRWQIGWLVGQAVKEFVGLAGLVIALLAGASAWAFGFALVSVVSMVMTPPWDHEVRLRVHRAEEARGAFLGR